MNDLDRLMEWVGNGYQRKVDIWFNGDWSVSIRDHGSPGCLHVVQGYDALENAATELMRRIEEGPRTLSRK